MKKIIYLMLVLFLASSFVTYAQVTIGSQDEPQAFSLLELISDGKKGLRLPQLTTAEKEILTNSTEFQSKKNAEARGLMIFNKDSKCVEVWSGAEWISRCEDDQYICATPDIPEAITFTGTGSPLNLNETFTAHVTMAAGITYNWTVPYGMEITTNSNNQITIKVVKAGSYPMNLITVSATNDCGKTSTKRVGSSSAAIEVNDCSSVPTLTSATVSNSTVVSGAKSGSGTSVDPYVVNAGQVITLNYTGFISGETYSWSLNSNGSNHFNIESNNGTFFQLRAMDVVSTCSADAIGLTATNECGSSSRVNSDIYIKIEALTYPMITGTITGNNCGTGVVILKATASAGAGVRWYDVSTEGTVLGSGDTFTTPSLSSTKTYYAEAYNTAENTTSLNRTAVIATINIIPTVSKVKDTNRAGAGTVNLQGCATASSGASVRYFSDPSGGTALSDNTTANLTVGTHTFYAEAYTSTCTSDRIAITVIVTAGTGMAISPANPSTVPATGTDAARTTSTITVSNPDCLTSGNYSFSISGTGASLASSNGSTGKFTVRFTENTGAARSATVRITDPCGNIKSFTFNQAARPVVKVTNISISGNSSVDIGSTISLSATVSPSNATNKNVTWSVSSGTSYASISSSGVVTGKAAGTATIRATAADGSGVTATKTISVLPAGMIAVPNGVYQKKVAGDLILTITGGFASVASGRSHFTATNKTLYVNRTQLNNVSHNTATSQCAAQGKRLPNFGEAASWGSITAIHGVTKTSTRKKAGYHWTVSAGTDVAWDSNPDAELGHQARCVKE